ncbi:hypothetical protein EDB80DRAFT_266833 [Ilyonectria destructans]|nr:hypothetical protein EDB80DRAFT_266833 [Ilyonectria destructans]
MEAVAKSKRSPTEDTAELGAESVIHLDRLPIPQSGDSIDVLQRKLTALADAVRCGQSIAVVTNYAASTIQERDPVKIALAEMPPQELDFWSLYAEGKYQLPKIDWHDSRDSVPTSGTPLRTARRRAEALNRLYKTDNVDPGQAVWFTKNEAFHLPLVKAMARVIGAERNLLGGQGALDPTQMADLQSINEILSVSAQISHEPGRNAISQAIVSAQRILGSHRDKIREIIGGSARKRKRHSE